MPSDQIVETIVTEGDIVMKSTVDNVKGAANQVRENCHMTTLQYLYSSSYSMFVFTYNGSKCNITRAGLIVFISV